MTTAAERFEALRQKGARDPEKVAGDIVFHVQENIVEKLLAKGWKRRDLATAMNTSKPAVTNLLRSDANLTLKRIAAVAIALGVSPFDLLRERRGVFAKAPVLVPFSRPTALPTPAATQPSHAKAYDVQLRFGLDEVRTSDSNGASEVDLATTA